MSLSIVPDHIPAGDEAAPAAAVDVERDWAAWLEGAIKPDWRPDEWDAESLTFTGDPGNVYTAVRRCSTVACPDMSKGIRCPHCTKRWKASGLSSAEFAATYVPDRLSPYNVRPMCTAASGTCQREARVSGMCTLHNGRWRGHLSRHPGASCSAWLAAAPPFGPLPPCSIAGCMRDGSSTSPNLCPGHRFAWTKEQKRLSRAGVEEDLAEWIATANPYLAMHQFSLAPVQPLVRLELLYALQYRGERRMLCPANMRTIVRTLRRFGSIVLEADAVASYKWPGESNAGEVLDNLCETLRVAFDKYRNIDPSENLVWDLAHVPVQTPHRNGGRRVRGGTVGFTPVKQAWLRDLLMHWARSSYPNSRILRDRLRACSIASDTLRLRPGGGDDPSALTAADMTAVANEFRVAIRTDTGTVMAWRARRALLQGFRDLLMYARVHSLVPDLSASFVVLREHRIPADDDPEDVAGRAVPEAVIAQLDEHLHLIGEGVPYGRLFTPQQLKDMFRTVYLLLRDTGRRPYEIADLSLDCVEYVGGEYFLRWDNRKAGRAGRLLEITRETAETIETWREVRVTIATHKRSQAYLFPSVGERSQDPCLKSGNIAVAIRAWADSIPRIDSSEVGPDGELLPFDRKLIVPYGFRHSYAQRHADADVPVDTLKELMDHRSVETTMGYYRVSRTRRREAVETVRLHVMDRRGVRTPAASGTAYEMRSVSVPFGNCQEPSNVKAGGKACPIRFQCAGCGFYRPDPSYLPAIEDHVRALKANRETALAMDAASFVVENLDAQIGAFAGVADVIRDHLDGLEHDEREEIEEASRVLRKVRAGASSTMLGMPAMPRRRDETTS